MRSLRRRKKTQRVRRSWTSEERAVAVACVRANGGRLTRTAKQIGVPVSCLREWTQGRSAVGQRALHDSRQSAQNLSLACDRLAMKLARLSQQRMAKLSSLDAAKVAGLVMSQSRRLQKYAA